MEKCITSVRSILILITFSTVVSCFPNNKTKTVNSLCANDSKSLKWISTWLSAWEFTSQSILKIRNTDAPKILLYDSKCIWTTSKVSAPKGKTFTGPRLFGRLLPWRVDIHNNKLKLPTRESVDVQLMSFAGPGENTENFFVMAAPTFWVKNKVKSLELGLDKLLVGVFLHEMTHTRQFYAFNPKIERLTKKWALPDDLNDDWVQEHFKSNKLYVEAYKEERDLFFLAAKAKNIKDVRRFALRGLRKLIDRHKNWFTGKNLKFREIDEVFLSLEGLGNWSAYAWLINKKGGSLDPKVALKGFRRNGNQWSQDEGLAMFLVIDRLLPNWKKYAFAEKPLSVFELLKLATDSKN